MSNKQQSNNQEKKIQNQTVEQNEKNKNIDKKAYDKSDKIDNKIKNQKRFRVQERKRIQIPNHLNSREKAQILRNITIYLFGSRRYKDIQLSCNLKSFNIALQIANIIYHRVDGLAMIIKFQKIPYIEYEDQNSQGVKKQYSILILKLTKSPTEKDQIQPGYHPGKSREQILQPLTEIWTIKDQGYRNQNRRREKDYRQYRDNRSYNDNKYVQRDRRDNKQYNRQYKQKRDYKDKDYNRERNYNYNKDYNSREYPRRYEDNYRKQKNYRQEYKEKQDQKKYRQLNNEKVNDNTERRGERKSRGVTRNNVHTRVQHDYNPKHLTRDVNVNRKQKNRYDDEN